MILVTFELPYCIVLQWEGMKQTMRKEVMYCYAEWTVS
jgi:hypothetical protein